MPPKPKLAARQKLREDFLDAFVFSLISNSPKTTKEIEEFDEIFPETVTLRSKKPKVMPMLQRGMPKISQSVASPKLPPLPRVKLAPKKLTKPVPRLPQTPTRPIQIKPVDRTSLKLPEYQQQILKPGEKPESIHLGRVASLIKDPAVLSVECPGPAKNVLVNRGGAVQTTSTVLTKEEIQQIMESLSQKTKIPLTSGLFKAAFQDLIITAVVSDFVGTRFMIQKRTPYQEY